MDRDDKDLLINVILDVLFTVSSQMLGPPGLKEKKERKKERKKSLKWFGHNFFL